MEEKRLERIRSRKSSFALRRAASRGALTTRLVRSNSYLTVPYFCLACGRKAKLIEDPCTNLYSPSSNMSILTTKIQRLLPHFPTSQRGFAAWLAPVTKRASILSSACQSSKSLSVKRSSPRSVFPPLRSRGLPTRPPYSFYCRERSLLLPKSDRISNTNSMHEARNPPITHAMPHMR